MVVGSGWSHGVESLVCFPQRPMNKVILIGWSKEQLLQAWVENPGAVCEDAGVMLPENLNIENIDIVHGVPDAMTPEDKQSECGVCTTPCVPGVVMPCDHVFCKDCWQQ